MFYTSFSIFLTKLTLSSLSLSLSLYRYFSNELRIDRLRPLHKLIKSNHIVHISNFICFGKDPCSAIPHLSTRILFHLSRFSNTSLTRSVFELLDERDILRLIAGYTARLREGLFGFVPGTPSIITDPTLIGVFQSESSLSSSSSSSSHDPQNLPRTILELMLQSLEERPLNLAQMLLGYKERAAILSQVSSQQQNLYDDPRARLVFNPACEETPLHVICTFLNSPNACIEMPHLAEACFELLYELCRSGATSVTTTLYLRSYGGQNFVSHQLDQLPRIMSYVAQRHHNDEKNENIDENCALTNVCAWILKLAALEIHLNVRAGVTRLHYVHDNLSKMFHFEQSRTVEEQQEQHAGQSRMGIFEVLDKIVPTNTPPVLPPEIRRAVRNNNTTSSQCVETRTYGGNEFARLNIVMLCRELDLSGAVGLSRERLRELLSIAVRWNEMEQQIASQLHLFQAWNQFVVISFMDGFPKLEERGMGKSPLALLVRLIEAALIRIRSHPSSKPYLFEPLAESVLMFLCKLREQIKDNPFAISISEFRNLLSHLLLTLTHCESGTSTTSSSHELRGSLYSSVLILLKLASSSSIRNFKNISVETKTMEQHRWRQRKLLEIVQDMLDQSGEALIRLVSRDSAVGLPVWRSLALSTLDALVANDGSGRCVSFLRHSGHVQRVVRFVNELPANVIGPFARVKAQREAEERIAVYDKAVSLLTRIAQNRSGCALLLQSGVMDAVRSCPAFSKAPERSDGFQSGNNEKLQWLIESPVTTFRKILAPSLRLILSLSISMPQSRNNPGQLSVLHLLKERFAVFVWCLRKALELPRPVDDRYNAVDDELRADVEDSKVENDDVRIERIRILKTAELATAILANATWNFEMFEEGVGQVRALRYASLMKALIQRLSRTPTSVRKPIDRVVGDDDEYTIYDWRLRVLRNAVVFCRRQCISVVYPGKNSTFDDEDEMMRTELESEYFRAPSNWSVGMSSSENDTHVGDDGKEQVATVLDVAECIVSSSSRIEKILNSASNRTNFVTSSSSSMIDSKTKEEIQSNNMTSIILKEHEELSLLTYVVENLLSLLLLHCHHYWRKAKFKSRVPNLLTRLLQDLRHLDRRDTFHPYTTASDSSSRASLSLITQ